jgi:phospholipid/cholesterol/gamma-HCH transport system permease protein
VLDAQGIDPMIYLVMPRVLGILASVFCLAVMFSVFSFLSGYLFGMLLGVARGESQQFLGSVAGAISIRDVANFLAKTIIPGFTTGTICCIEGLNVRGAVTEVPQAATRAVVKSIAAVLVVSAIVSVLTYV